MSEFFWSMMLSDFESNHTVMNRASRKSEDNWLIPLELITKELIEPQGRVVGSRTIRFENKSTTE